MAYIISADEIKKRLPGYDPENAGELHSESAKLADQEYYTALQHRSEPKVILFAGGAASGKSEYISAHLRDEDAIIFDSTMRTFVGAKRKITSAVRANKLVEVVLVLPKDIKVAFDAFLHRDRKFSEVHFYQTHSFARKTVTEVAHNFDIPISIFISSYEKIGEKYKTVFDEVDTIDKEGLLEFLTSHQYTEDEIKGIITDEV